MKKSFTLLIFLICVQYVSFSQYADLGTGALKDDIWWLDWAGMNLTTNPSRTVTTPDGLTITYTYIGSIPNYAVPRVMNTWSGAVLHLLYNFSDPAIQPALYQSLGAGSNIQFNVRVQVTRNGLPVPFTMVAADAEASNKDEVTTFMTNHGVWQMVDFYRNSSQTTNPVSGCNTNTVILTDTYGNAAATGQNPVLASSTPNGDITIWTNMDHRATGGMAVAFGIMAPIDRGDLPASFGNAFHGLTYSINNGCNYLPPLPSATKSQTLMLGTIPGDADGAQTLDDNASGFDEEGVYTIPAYLNNGSYTLLVSVRNTTGSDAYLTGWLDYNRNGIFDNGESVTVTVPNNASTANLTWPTLPTWLPQGAVTDYGVRLRLSSDRAATQSATGFAKDGEVEDYIFPAEDICHTGLYTIPDTAVCVGQPVTLTTVSYGITNYSWDQPTYLNDATMASPVSQPGGPITYTVTGSNPQGCEITDKVTISMTNKMHISVTGNATICNGATVPLSVNAPGAVSYTWLPQTGLNNNTIANPLAQPTANTTYVVTTDDGHGCIGEDSVKIILRPLPNFVANQISSPVCEHDLIRLTASGGDDYTWLDGNNTQVGTTAAVSISATTSQTYTVVIKESQCNYTDTRSIPVTVNSAPVPAISKSNDVDCNTMQATLHVSGGSTYVWDVMPGISDLTATDPVVTPLQTTTYVVKVTDNIGCAASGSVTVTADTRKPVITVNNDTTICTGTVVQLSANAPGAVSYTWLPQTGLNNSAIPTPIAQPAVATTYVVNATGSNGCIGKDSVMVTFYGPPAFFVSPSNATLCEKDSVQLAALGGIDYTWLAPDNSVLGTTASLMAHPVTTQTYRVIIKDLCNNSATRSIPVTVNTRPIAAITKSNDVDCSTGQATLHATGGVDYVWKAAPGIEHTNSANPKVTPPQTTTYVVTVTNSKGCSTRDSITVVADFAKAMSVYPVPSAFTPNNDGRNDCFGLKLWGQVTQLQFQVFNRWGQRVFSTTDPTQCWDGTFTGEPVPAGGYVYSIKAVTRCGSVNRSGMVIVIR